MGFFKSKNGSIMSDYFKLLEKIGNYEAGNMYDVALYNDHLEITGPFQKNKIILNYNQITDIFYGYQTDLKEVKKSVISRAVAGGLLFGGLGAVVGSVSGVGTKTKQEKNLYLIISYTSLHGEEQFIQFEDTRKYKGGKLVEMLRGYTGITNPANRDIQL